MCRKPILHLGEKRITEFLVEERRIRDLEENGNVEIMSWKDLAKREIGRQESLLNVKNEGILYHMQIY